MHSVSRLPTVSLCALVVFALPFLMGLGCPATMPPVPTGSCCAPDGTCTVTAQADCSTGSWTQGNSCSPNPCTPAPTPVTPQLFIANITGNTVISYLNPAAVNGNIPPSTIISGPQTSLSGTSDIAVTASGILLAVNFTAVPPSITVYPGASSANGNVVPARIVQGANTGMNAPTTLAISAPNDLAFVANLGGTFDINVFSGTSTSGFLGNLPPARTIKSASLNQPFGINFGPNDELYVANHGDNKVLVFNSASTRNGTIAPDRTLTNAAFADIYDVFVDSADRLYIVNSMNGGANKNQVHVINGASTKNGAVIIDATLTVTGAVNLSAIAVDKNGTGYIVERTNSSIFVYDAINTRNGALAADRTIAGASTQMSGPFRVFLVE